MATHYQLMECKAHLRQPRFAPSHHSEIAQGFSSRAESLPMYSCRYI
jgi:hypothetical protein